MGRTSSETFDVLRSQGFEFNLAMLIYLTGSRLDVASFSARRGRLSSLSRRRTSGCGNPDPAPGSAGVRWFAVRRGGRQVGHHASRRQSSRRASSRALPWRSATLATTASLRSVSADRSILTLRRGSTPPSYFTRPTSGCDSAPRTRPMTGFIMQRTHRSGRSPRRTLLARSASKAASRSASRPSRSFDRSVQHPRRRRRARSASGTFRPA
jgi:hypothetical protein